MNRRSDKEQLEELFAKLRSRIPDLVIRTSVITGLPGEGEAEFKELCEFLKRHKLERVGAFPFSPEEGTPAADMEFVDSEAAQSRAQQIETIQSRIMDDYNASMQGKVLDVLVDGPFVEAKKNLSLRFRGSENQRLIDVPASLQAGKICLWEDNQKGMREHNDIHSR